MKRSVFCFLKEARDSRKLIATNISGIVQEYNGGHRKVKKRLPSTLFALALAASFGILAAPSAAAITPPPGPVLEARYDFNTVTSGQVADLSGNGNTLTVNGATTSTDAPSSLFGDSLSFDGTDDYASAANSTSLDITGPITVEGWVKLSSFSQQATVAGKWKDTGGTSQRGYLLTVDTTGRPRFYVSTNGGNYYCATGSQLSTNVWYHLAGTWDGTTIKVYVGTSSTSASQIGSIFSNDQPLLIGANDGWGGSNRKFTNGLIDEVRIWKGVLSENQLDDMLPPVISVTGITNGATYLLNQAVDADWSVADNNTGTGAGDGVTGVESVSVNGAPQSTTSGITTLDTSVPGTHTVTVSANDYAMNEATATLTYNVIGFSGFLPPVVEGRCYKSGSTIPVKFQLTDASGDFITGATATISVQQNDSNPLSATAIDVTSSGSANTGDAFRYDPTGNQYIYNLSTKGLGPGDYTITVTVNGTGIATIDICLK